MMGSLPVEEKPNIGGEGGADGGEGGDGARVRRKRRPSKSEGAEEVDFEAEFDDDDLQQEGSEVSMTKVREKKIMDMQTYLCERIGDVFLLISPVSSLCGFLRSSRGSGLVFLPGGERQSIGNGGRYSVEQRNGRSTIRFGLGE